jgi:hypothetical protein
MTPTKDRIVFTTDLHGTVYTLEFADNGPDKNMYVKCTKDGALHSLYTLNEEEKQ